MLHARLVTELGDLSTVPVVRADLAMASTAVDRQAVGAVRGCVHAQGCGKNVDAADERGPSAMDYCAPGGFAEHQSSHGAVAAGWAAAGGPVDAAVDPETVSSCCGRVFRRGREGA